MKKIILSFVFLLSGCSANISSSNIIATSTSKITTKENIDYKYNDFIFENFENEYIISKYIGGDNKVIIPESYNGKKIIGIGNDAFAKDNNINELILNDSMHYFPKNCFNNLNISYTYDDGFMYLGSLYNKKYLLVSLFEKKEEYKISAECKVIKSEAIKYTLAKKITIPSNVEYINDDGISKCYNLEELIDFSSSINDKFISETPKIEYMYFNVKKYSDNFYMNKNIKYLFKSNVNLKNTYSGILDVIKFDNSIYYLKNNEARILKIDENLKEYSMPRSIKFNDGLNYQIKKLYAHDFENVNLQVIMVSNTVTEVENDSFFNCFNLIRVEFAGIEKIDSAAFYGCKKLKSILFKNNDKAINTFFKNNLDTTIYFEGKKSNNPGNIRNYRENVNTVIEFDKMIFYIDKNNKMILSDAQSDIEILNIPNYVKYENEYYPVVEIASGALKSLEYLKEVSIGDNILTIKEKAFYGCMNLKNIFIPNSVKNIEDNVFISNDMVIKVEAYSKPKSYSNNFHGNNKVVYNSKR